MADPLSDCRRRDHRRLLAFRSCRHQLGFGRMRSVMSPSASTARCKCSTTPTSPATPETINRQPAHGHQRRPRLRCITESVGGEHGRQSAREHPAARRQVTPIHSTGGTITTPTSPAALAFAADGSVYVASAGAPHDSSLQQDRDAPSHLHRHDRLDHLHWHRSESRPKDAVRGVWRQERSGRSRTSVSSSAAAPPRNLSPALTVATFVTLQGGSGTACGCGCWRPLTRGRWRRHRRHRCRPSVGSSWPTGAKIKRLDRFGAVVETFNAGADPDSKKNWIDVALDPNTQDFWGVDAGEMHAAGQVSHRRRQSAGAVAAQRRSPRRCRQRRAAGRSVDGYSISQRTWRAWRHSSSRRSSTRGRAWRRWPSRLPVQAYRGDRTTRSGRRPAVCPPSLNVRCRLQNFDDPVAAIPVPKAYSRGRSVVYREILLSALSKHGPVDDLVRLPEQRH